VEFAVISPVMMSIVIGAMDTTQAIVMQRRTIEVAQQVGEIATLLAVQPNQTTSLTPAQAQQAESVIFAILPQLRSAVGNPTFAVTVSDVVFSGTSPNYTANMAWSVPLSYGLDVYRPCGVVNQTTPTGTQRGSNTGDHWTTVPTSGMTSSLSSVLVVDVRVQFTPFFLNLITGSFTIYETAYFNQRSIVSSYITYDTSADPNVCPGYI
jgi:Flp pilus assembly protein TadG